MTNVLCLRSSNHFLSVWGFLNSDILLVQSQWAHIMFPIFKFYRDNISFPLLQEITTDTTFKMNFSGNPPILRRRITPFSNVPLLSQHLLYYDLLYFKISDKTIPIVQSYPGYLMWILILETSGLLVFALLLLKAYTSVCFSSSC